VVAASVAMEHAGSAIGGRFGVPDIVTGGVLLAAVTSLPNAVAAMHLASHGRGSATLSTTLNSNALNVVAGLFIPGAVTGVGSGSQGASLTAAWFCGLTLCTLVLAFAGRGLNRTAGVLVILGYLGFVASLIAG
jgi:Ca2+/Na+ antiporter